MTDYQDKRYAFYRILGAPVPLERNFFAYGEDESVQQAVFETDLSSYISGRDEDIAMDTVSDDSQSYDVLASSVLSRHTIRQDVQELCEMMNRRQWIWAWIPFVDAVYLRWSLTFNMEVPKHRAKFLILSDIGRVWHVWRIVQIVVGIMKIFARSHNMSISCDIVCDRTSAHLTKLKRWHMDVGFVYELAHAVPLYAKNEQHTESLYRLNTWIKDYLPQFPFKSCIRLPLKFSYGKSFLRVICEKIFWARIGDWLEFLLRRAGTWVVMIQKGRIATKHLIVKPDLLRKKLMLQRKIYTARSKHRKWDSWSRSLFNR